MSIDMLSDDQIVWKHYLSELEMCRDKLLEGNVESYENLFSTFATSLSVLDRQPREKTLGFATPLSFAKMYRRLCVTQKKTAVPNSMLKHLWQTESDEQASVIARKFVESGVANLEAVRSGGAYIWCLTIHNSLHDFVVAQSKLNGDTEEAHECLLKGYSSLDREISSVLKGTRRWWSRNLESDGYIHRNLVRHLAGAGLAAELVHLLLSPQWVRRKLEVDEILYLETDFSLGAAEVQNGMRDESEEERSAAKEAFRLISEAVTLSSGFSPSSAAELWFQLQGRLRRHCESNTAIQEYLEWIETKAARPLIVCRTSFLGGPGAMNKKIVAVSNVVPCVALLKDGERFACGCGDGRIAVVNKKRGQVENRWKAHDDEVKGIVVGRGGTRLISCSNDTTIKVWDLETCQCVKIFKHHSNWVNSIAMVKGGRHAISVSDDGTATFFDVETGMLLSTPFTGHHGECIKCLSVFGDKEHMVLTGGGEAMIRMWNVLTGTQVGPTFDGHEGLIRCLAVSPDGQRVVSGSWDETLRVWNAENHQQIGKSLRGHTDLVHCVAVSKDGRRAISGSWDKTIRVWDLDSQTEIIEPLEGHTSTVSGVSFLHDSDHIASCSYDGTLRIWDLTRKKTNLSTNQHSGVVSSISFTPNGKFMVSASWDKTLRVWNANSGKQLGAPLEGHSDMVKDAAVAPNGWLVVSVCGDGAIYLWNLESRELLNTLTGHTDSIECVAVTPQGNFAVTGSADKTVRIWDLAAINSSPIILRGHSSCVRRVFVSDDGSRAVSVDYERNIFVWELDSAKLIRKYEMEDAWKFSRREVLNLVGDTTLHDDTTLSIPLHGRNIIHGKKANEAILGTMETNISSWELSPDKRTFYVGLSDGQVAFLKLET